MRASPTANWDSELDSRHQPWRPYAQMEEAGIITSYRAEVNLGRLGLPILAIVRLGSFAGQSCNRVATQVSQIPEVLECYRVGRNRFGCYQGCCRLS